jgi:transcriptional regulator with XRE-family HTH domain
MSLITDDPTRRLAQRIVREREARGWSQGELARRSDVSKAMISKVEREEASPTAVLLAKVASAFGLTLATLLARAEEAGGRAVKAADQPQWTDPATGYMRRQLFARPDNPVELVRVELPPGAQVAFPAASYAFIRQAVWVLDGELVIEEAGREARLSAGDAYGFGEPADASFFNPAGRACAYVVAVARR